MREFFCGPHSQGAASGATLLSCEFGMVELTFRRTLRATNRHQAHTHHRRIVFTKLFLNSDLEILWSFVLFCGLSVLGLKHGINVTLRAPIT